jgi:hypothetical protein
MLLSPNGESERERERESRREHAHRQVQARQPVESFSRTSTADSRTDRTVSVHLTSSQMVGGAVKERL